MAGAVERDGEDEDFYDVPDEIAAVEVVSRGLSCVHLEWTAPCDNARQISCYQIFVQLWRLGTSCGPLPAQTEDVLPGEQCVEGSTDAGNARSPQQLSGGSTNGLGQGSPRRHALLLRASAAEVAASGAKPGCCRFRLQEPPHFRAASRRTAGSGSSQPAGEADGHINCATPVGAWVSVRARNAEGWADWARPALVFFRSAPAPGIENPPALYTWGLAEDGRLGRGRSALERGVCAEAGAVEALSGESIAALSLGSHSAAITSEDRLFVWGTYLAGAGSDAGAAAGEEKVCARDEVDLVVEPAVQATPFVPHDVACGRFATAVTSATGQVFVWGPNEAHQCGLKEPAVVRSLMQLLVPNGVPIARVALGEFHGLALSAHGTVFAWGMEQGPEVATGLSREQSRRLGSVPERAALNQAEPRLLEVPGLAVEVAAGGYHSALITEDGRLWTWGSNTHGQLGHGVDAPAICEPRHVRAFDGGAGKRVTSVSLGGFHSAAVNESGSAFTWGENKKGQCGQGEAGVVGAPAAVAFRGEEPRCSGASCGGFFTLFRVVAGGGGGGGGREGVQFHACGLGREGCLGFGQPCKRMLRPQPLPCRGSQHWTQMQAGMVHAAGLLATR